MMMMMMIANISKQWTTTFGSLSLFLSLSISLSLSLSLSLDFISAHVFYIHNYDIIIPVIFIV